LTFSHARAPVNASVHELEASQNHTHGNHHHAAEADRQTLFQIAHHSLQIRLGNEFRDRLGLLRRVAGRLRLAC
jgi:hypothetical protein